TFPIRTLLRWLGPDSVDSRKNNSGHACIWANTPRPATRISNSRSVARRSDEPSDCGLRIADCGLPRADWRLGNCPLDMSVCADCDAGVLAREVTALLLAEHITTDRPRSTIGNQHSPIRCWQSAIRNLQFVNGPLVISRVQVTLARSPKVC